MVLPYQGGLLLGSAQLVTIDWEDFPFDAEARAVGDYLPGSPWMEAVGAPYGVGLAGHSHYTLAGPTPQFGYPDAGDLGSILWQGIDAGWWPASPGDAGATPIWMFLLLEGHAPPPLSTYGGLHGGEVDAQGQIWITAWVQLFDVDAGEVAAQGMEDTISHETIESLTDPLFGINPGYFLPCVLPPYCVGTTAELPQELFTAILPEGVSSEVADMCEDDLPVRQGGFTLARSWSNSASLDGGDPCQPALPQGFIGIRGPSAPVLAAYGTTFQIPLVATATDPSAQWTLELENGFLTSSTLNVSEVSSGQPVVLTVSMPTLGSGPYQETIWSLDADGGVLSQWPIVLIAQ